jgi:hypothetical protein
MSARLSVILLFLVAIAAAIAGALTGVLFLIVFAVVGFFVAVVGAFWVSRKVNRSVGANRASDDPMEPRV